MMKFIAAIVAFAALSLASVIPSSALVPLSESNFYNAKCGGIANYNGDCTVQSMNPGTSATRDCAKGEKAVLVGRTYECVVA